ncbi:MAG TPA: HEAT repeat domain-containing protein [Terriglobia bacterium]|nr:HEAT repeat domain-containing protein [Terriglobia bacterium]
MVDITNPVMQWAFAILVSVLMGTCLLVAVAFYRRWQQIRYVRYVHTLQREYRPVIAKVLSGARNPSGIAALREMSLAELELLLDPLFSKRKLPERCQVFFHALCAELGLIELWQSRLANGHSAAPKSSGNGTPEDFPHHAKMRYPLRATSIRNLGTLRHRPSWPLLVDALDDRHPDIQTVALRSLAAIGAPESFPVLRERLHAVAQGKSLSPPLRVLQAAMVSFGLDCLPALLPSLRHLDRQVRLHATEILRTMVCREAARQPNPTLAPQLLTPQMVELVLTGLSVDRSAEIRACAAEVIVFLADARATSVLRDLLCDHQWFVRLRTVQALTHFRQAAAPLYLIRECLSDPHWGVREAAIQTLIGLGQAGKHELCGHFLTSPDRATRAQIVEIIERTGLMSALVEAYSAGTRGVEALMVEQLASEAAPLGLSGILRTLNPEIYQRFLDRFLPNVQARMRFLEETQPEVESVTSLQQALEFPPHLAA